jgi:quinoprotein glucose dehydrogenase
MKGLRKPANRSLFSHTSPPIVVKDVIVVGGAIDDFQETKEMPPGDVRGFDARTGRQLWRFHSVPQAGEFGNETWEADSWRYSGNTNVWTLMSADPELGYVYLPFGTANNDWYGGHRPGANLFSESLVCLDARTGKRVWHFQMVHHGLWDYDLPCAPNLIDVTVGGKRVKAVAQVSKQAFCYVFDRVTGKPLWPIEERPVPQQAAPGDRAHPTQPYPTKPAPFDLQNAVEENLIDFTPQLRAEAKSILDTWHHGPLYTPPLEKRTMMLPGWVGGASWAGASTDPETGILYVPSVQNAMWLNLAKPKSPSATVDLKIDQSGHDIPGPQGLPLFKPPWGRITAINLNNGNHQWMSVVGDGPRKHPAIKHLQLGKLGINRRIFTLTTQTLLIAMQEGAWFNEKKPDYPPKLWAFDKATGKQLAEVSIPAHATGAPITYSWKGRQYIAYPSGGAIDPAKLIALSLP